MGKVQKVPIELVERYRAAYNEYWDAEHAVNEASAWEEEARFRAAQIADDIAVVTGKEPMIKPKEGVPEHITNYVPNGYLINTAFAVGIDHDDVPSLPDKDAAWLNKLAAAREEEAATT